MATKFKADDVLVMFLLVCTPVFGQYTPSPISLEYYVPQGGSQTLNCSQSEAPALDTWWNVTWVLPNLTLLQRDLKGSNKMEAETTFSVSQDGQLLFVDNLQPDWYGEYYCMVLHDPYSFYVTRFGLNTSYFYAAELWEEYRHMLILLGVVSGTILAMLTLLFSLIIWCRSSRRQADRGGARLESSDAGSVSTADTEVKAESVWDDYLGPNLVYPGSDKTL